SLKRALEMILDIAYAICHLHTHGIIHRDLKLENILINEQGEIKLIDFGIAQLLDDVKTEERSVFQYRTIGTPIYMSPEQRANPNSVSYPSDIYSLGIIAYELVLGRLSHGHVHLSLMPKGLQKILAKALQPDPQQRYQDIVDFIADLSAYLGSTTLDQERKVGDRTSELYDSLHQAKRNLLPQKVPAWPLLEMGLDTNLTTFDGAIYGDFIKLNEDSYRIFFGTSLGIDAEGLLADAAMRSRIRALCLQEEMPLKDLADLLNRILLQEPYEAAFALCGLAISPLKGHLHFISCGYGVLWHIPKETGIPYQVRNDNGCLKVDGRLFHETFCPMKAGDQFLLYGENRSAPETEALLFQGIVEYGDLSPQLKAEGISRKLKVFSAKEPSHQFVIAIVELCNINQFRG
ncbi:MAG: serine/threonine protein kinase, partial [Parachlamydiaceae bacterium]